MFQNTRYFQSITTQYPQIHILCLQICMFGAVAGAASVIGNNPIDVVKTRVQNGVSVSSLQCARDIFVNDGIRGFYRGCLPRLNRVTLEVALAFVIYDSVVNFIRRF